VVAQALKGELARHNRRISWTRCLDVARRLGAAAPAADPAQLIAYLEDALDDLGSSRMSDYGMIAKLERDALEAGALTLYLASSVHVELGATERVEDERKVEAPPVDLEAWRRRQDERAASWEREALETPPALAAKVEAQAERARIDARRRELVAQAERELAQLCEVAQ